MRVKIKKTLKSGDKIWVAGEILKETKDCPLPQVIVTELELNTGTVELMPELVAPKQLHVKDVYNRDELEAMNKPELVDILKPFAVPGLGNMAKDDLLAIAIKKFAPDESE